MLKIKVHQGYALRAIVRASKAVNPPGPLLEKIGHDLVVSTKERFRDGIDPDGKKWKPKSKTTILRHPRSGTRPLIGESKTLGSTIAHQVKGGSVYVGSNVVYAAVHQFGAKRGSLWKGITKSGRKAQSPWGNIPARPYLGISRQDRQQIHDTVEEWIANHLE